MLSDKDILKEIKEGNLIIKPFNTKDLQPNSIDIHLSDTFLIFKDNIPYINPKIKQDITLLYKDNVIVLNPNEFILASTIERIELNANNIVARLEGKSSLARLGLLIHSTAGFIDTGFKGNITLEIKNINKLPIRLEAGMKIGQISFYYTSSPTLKKYGDKTLNSKYQNQNGVVESRFWQDYKEKEV